jgi:hypothetical protein
MNNEEFVHIVEELNIKWMTKNSKHWQWWLLARHIWLMRNNVISGGIFSHPSHMHTVRNVGGFPCGFQTKPTLACRQTMRVIIAHSKVDNAHNHSH